MVQNFIEESNTKESTVRCGSRQCHCINRNGPYSSEEDSDSYKCFNDSSHPSASDSCELLKSLTLCASVSERNLLADATKIVQKRKIFKYIDDFSKNIVVHGLLALGYDASLCQSRWEKSPSFPSGEYEYVDVILGEERLIVDIDFRSEFEIARPTKSYKSVLRCLPRIFVGKTDRLERIICVVSEAAKQSLRKKGMSFPPWRKADYVKAKWLSPCTRITPSPPPQPQQSTSSLNPIDAIHLETEKKNALMRKKSSCGELELIFGERNSEDAIALLT